MMVETFQDAVEERDPARAECDAVAASVLPPLSEAEFMELLVELCVGFAPRRFALGEVYGDYDDGQVLAWGMTFGDRAVLCSDDGRPIGVFPSAERALARLSGRANLRLVWIDPETEDEVCAREEEETGG